MEVLEIEKPENKKIIVYIINKENHKLSKIEARNLGDFLQNCEFNFTTIDLMGKNLKELNKSPLAKFLEDFLIQFWGVDIPEYAKGYLSEEISNKKEQINELESEYENLLSNPAEKDSFKAQNLDSWIVLLKDEINDKENYLKLKVKPQWIVKKIFDNARVNKKNSLIILHFSPEELVPEIEKLLQEFKISVIIHNLNTEISDRTFSVKNNVITSNQFIK